MRSIAIYLGVVGLVGAGCALGEDSLENQEQASRAGGGAVEVSAAVRHDTSPALRGMPATDQPTEGAAERPLRLIPGIEAADADDPIVQSAPGPRAAIANFSTFPGVGNGDYGFAPDAAPPDTEGVVGATQYVQWVNEKFAVFDKTTHGLVLGPVNGNSIWSGFGGGCETNNDGDPIVQYDKANNRWIFTQFSVSTQPYLQCVAVSTTSDATGSYNRYAFQYSQFPDYPKLGVWPDAYYITFNMFTSTFQGARVCAYDAAAMRAGAAATQQCFQTSSSFGGLLPSDLDGSTAPPLGSPNYVMNFGSNSLRLWKFHVDWIAPANTTFTGPTTIPVAAFKAACRGGGACIPQADTSEKLDSLADRLMYRLAYRNFGDHESLVVNHSVSVTKKGQTGVRWYEIRSPGGTPAVYQQGTFAPDSSSRWMGSIAMDKLGNIALGYSVSSSAIHPGIRYATRLATDVLGTLGVEASIIEGGGSQQRSLNRWGDYSAMTVDPVDDCTFWYTNEYEKVDGTFNWSTQIASFKIVGCN